MNKILEKLDILSPLNSEENYDYIKLKQAYELLNNNDKRKISSPKSLLRETKNRYERYIYHITDWSEYSHMYEKILSFLEMDYIDEKQTRLERLKLMKWIDRELIKCLNEN
jgi:hypothetical protein